jgi:hypothetical protein
VNSGGTPGRLSLATVVTVAACVAQAGCSATSESAIQPAIGNWAAHPSMIYQYRLPVTASSKPVRTLGPTKANYLGVGDPISGGFNKSNTKLALMDGLGWLNVGKVGPNTWKIVLSQNFQSPSGAAFTPSDK